MNTSLKKQIDVIEQSIKVLSSYIEAQKTLLDDITQRLECIVEENLNVPVEENECLDDEISIKNLRCELTNRSINILRAANIMTNRELCKLTEEELRLLRNCGIKTLDDIRIYLKHHGLKLGSIPK